MSFNISQVIVVKIENAWIAESDRLALVREHGHELPELCSLRDLPRWARPTMNGLAPADENGRRYILDWRWSGEGSGTSFNDLFQKVASKIHGRIELVLIWEGGESVSGVRIVDTVMTEPFVSYVLDDDIT